MAQVNNHITMYDKYSLIKLQLMDVIGILYSYKVILYFNTIC